MSGPHPAVAAARVAVADATADLPAGALVLVACSGGADSLALAAATAFVARRAGLRAGAVVVDHGLQQGSADVANEAADACRSLGLDPVLVRRVDVSGGGGPEKAARDARYAALEEAADDERAGAVLLGHTLDDQAETVLLGLARGSGARSLAGMPAVRGILRRPLLGLRRSETEAACRAQGLEPWHDPTNAGAPDDPVRSRLRAEVMPALARVLGPGVPQALARTAEQLAQDAEALDALASQLLAASRVAPPDAPTVGAPPHTASLDPGRVGAFASNRDIEVATRRGSDDSRAARTGRAGDASAARTGHADDASAARTGHEGDERPAHTAHESGQAAAAVVWLDLDVLGRAATAVRRRALRAAAVEAGSPPGSLHRVHVLALDALVTDWRGQGAAALPGGLAGARACGRLVIGSPAALSGVRMAGRRRDVQNRHTNEE
ncbi:tRNA lysidine(34) synthetase TilS [Cellulomonas edaphi]|uniref:tRNA lysidine(34) synthetase TilS n=1 Tax=Cellulomonas edaphi TaxID=3053468 RepID=UPI002DD6B917|nr:tRNA lysidine(34) synthetase TilS [Cellulomons edaphi]